MKWLAPSVLFAAVCAAPLIPGHAEDVKLVTPEQMKWVAFEGIPGTQITVLSGDPAKEGQFVIEWGGPAGIKVPPHWHSITARVMMISGTGMLAMGDNLDLKKGTPLVPNAYYEVPPKMHHWFVSTSPFVMMIEGIGPLDNHYVKSSGRPCQKSRQVEEDSLGALLLLRGTTVRMAFLALPRRGSMPGGACFSSRDYGSL